MDEKTKEEHIHYLKVLKKDSGVMQPEIRNAIGYCIEKFNTEDTYIKNRRKLLKRLTKLFYEREKLSKEILRLRKELNVLDNMIL